MIKKGPISIALVIAALWTTLASQVQAKDEKTEKNAKNDVAATVKAGMASTATSTASGGAVSAAGKEAVKVNAKKLPDSYWKGKLDPSVYQVTRCSATEAPFTGKYWNNHEAGVYKCSNCGATLFDSKTKFDSGTGWPSFTAADNGSVETKVDSSMGMRREEVICKNCGAHLGHLFDDGPAPSGQRYCINSASLDFKDQKAQAAAGAKK